MPFKQGCMYVAGRGWCRRFMLVRAVWCPPGTLKRCRRRRRRPAREVLQVYHMRTNRDPVHATKVAQLTAVCLSVRPSQLTPGCWRSLQRLVTVSSSGPCAAVSSFINVSKVWSISLLPLPCVRFFVEDG